MTLRAWAELLRVSALFTVPGDALAGAASAGVRPNRGTALAVGASLCLYEAGMALNDWADRDEDAVERPHRPIPSGRITPNAALAAAGGLTAAGLLLASRAGRPALALSTALAASVWAYDLRLKHTAAGPVAMGAARALDVLLGATATASASRRTPAHLASPPARRGVLARLSAWAGASKTGPSPTPASRLNGAASQAAADATASTARFSPPAEQGVLARLSAWADGPARERRTTATPGGLAGKLAALAPRAALEPGASTARFPAPGGSAGHGPTTSAGSGPARLSAAPATPPGLFDRLSAWADNSDAAFGPPGRGGGPGHHAVPRGALLPAALLGAHTVAVTGVSRNEVYGGSVGAPLAALVVTGVLGGVVGRSRDPGAGALVSGGLAAAYALTAGRPFLHAALNPSPQLTQRAVGGGIRAMIPFQAALAARGGSPVVGLAVMGLVPLARKFAKKVSVT